MNLTSVLLAISVLEGNLTWKHTLNQFMKERSHFNVISVITVVLRMAAWKSTFNQFMKEENISNAAFVTTNLIWRVRSKDTWNQFIKDRKSFKCDSCSQKCNLRKHKTTLRSLINEETGIEFLKLFFHLRIHWHPNCKCLTKEKERKLTNICLIIWCFANKSRWNTQIIVPSMSFYSDFNQVLSIIYPDLTQISKKLTLSKSYPDFILIFEKIWIKLEKLLYPDFIQI